MSSSSTKIEIPITLISEEGDSMTVDYEVMKLSKLVEESLGDDPESHDNALLPLPKIKTQVLKKVIEYCTHYKHVEAMKEISTPLPGDVMEEIVQDW